MRGFHKSIRWRLQVWHGLILLVVLAAFGLTAYVLVRENSFKRIDAELQRRITLVVSGIGPPRWSERRSASLEAGFHLSREHRSLFEGEGATSFYYAVMSSAGRIIAASASAPPGVPVPGIKNASDEPVARQRGEFRELVSLSAGPFYPGPGPGRRDPTEGPPPPFRSLPLQILDDLARIPWLHFPVSSNLPRKLFPQTTVVVGCSILPVRAELRHLAWWFAVVGGGVIFFGLATGWLISARIIKPISTISEAAVMVASGNLSARIKVADTTSELGELAGVLNETFHRLQSAFARQVQFTADASHELRTPTFVILSQAQSALKRERTAAEYREGFEVCQLAAQQMGHLVESLLILARQDAHASDLHRVPCALDRMVTESVSLLRSLAADQDIMLVLDLNSVVVSGDPQQLEQVITNLVINAIEYNRPGGEVEVSVTQDSGGVVLSVRDTGLGISAGDLPHVFDRFYRADPSRSSAHGHTGLGLSICKAIVESHGGKITVTSEPGRHTTFKVVLPRSSTTAPVQAITPSITFP